MVCGSSAHCVCVALCILPHGPLDCAHVIASAASALLKLPLTVSPSYLCNRMVVRFSLLICCCFLVISWHGRPAVVFETSAFYVSYGKRCFNAVFSSENSLSESYCAFLVAKCPSQVSLLRLLAYCIHLPKPVVILSRHYNIIRLFCFLIYFCCAMLKYCFKKCRTDLLLLFV